jgi:1-acyl-sn-glycerol-3-phosphate acyltransferase
MSVIRFLRFLFISCPLLALLSLVWPAASLLLWICDRGPDTQLELGRIWAKTFLMLSFIRVRYEGLENLDGYGSAGVAVANHPGPLDIPVLYGLPAQGVFFAAKRLFFNPFCCIQLRAGGHLPTGGRNGRDTIKSIRLGIRLITETGRGVLIFPELWHSGGELHPFQEGAALIAIMAGAPIVPIAISGTRQFMGGTVAVRIGEPIRTVGMQISDRTWLTKHLHDRVAEMLHMEAEAPDRFRRTA